MSRERSSKTDGQLSLDRLRAALDKLDNVYPHTIDRRAGEPVICEDGLTTFEHFSSARRSLDMILRALT